MFSFLGKVFLLSISLLVGCDKRPIVTDSSNNAYDSARELGMPFEKGGESLQVQQSDAPVLVDGVVGYQIWVRSFYDSDGDGNGDIDGLREKLPYLKSLGVGAIWLSPIFESPSYHGYDTTDYYKIDNDYGTMADFDRFISEAKKQDIRVILDLVINHVSDQHPWFIKSLNKDPEYADYFVWSNNLPPNYGPAWFNTPDPTRVWHYKEAREGDWYYGVFGYQQPDLNLKNPKVFEEIKEVAAFWLDKGVDGFRLDAIRYLIEEGGIPHQADTQSTLDLLSEFNSFVKSKNPNAYLIGEVHADNEITAKYYAEGNGIDAVFDFHFSKYIVDSFYVNPMDIKPSQEEVEKYIENIKGAFWKNLNQRMASGIPPHFFSPLMNNHDSERAVTIFDNSLARAKVAAAMSLTSPGTPFIYYGEEIGMPQAGTMDDMYRRALMQWDDTENSGFNNSGKRWLDEGSWFPWNADFKPWWNTYWLALLNRNTYTVAGQKNNSDSLLNFYTALIDIRKKNLALSTPEEIVFYDNTGSIWVTKYSKEGETVWVLINLNFDTPASFSSPNSMKGAYVNLINNQQVNAETEIVLDSGEVMILVKK